MRFQEVFNQKGNQRKYNEAAQKSAKHKDSSCISLTWLFSEYLLLTCLLSLWQNGYNFFRNLSANCPLNVSYVLPFKKSSFSKEALTTLINSSLLMNQ
jgi:hypothetical protein